LAGIGDLPARNYLFTVTQFSRRTSKPFVDVALLRMEPRRKPATKPTTNHTVWRIGGHNLEITVNTVDAKVIEAIEQGVRYFGLTVERSPARSSQTP
jgi:hypothetical protein